MKYLTRRGAIGLALSVLAPLASVAAPTIIPLPVQMQTLPGFFTLCPTQAVMGVPARATRKIVVDSPSLQTGQYLAMMLFRSTGYQFAIVTNNATGPVRGAILLTTVNATNTLGSEGYQLTVSPDSVVISAQAQAGVFYGVQTLLQLFPPQIYSQQNVTNVAWTAPCVYVLDQPRFGWRGAMLDVARHFQDKQEVERVIDAMAWHKLNTLHLHLCDDQGWRVQILSFPLLTSTGGWRNSMDYGLNPASSTAYRTSSPPYGGYYTQDDVREMVAYAQQRHITIVPEIELPAHSSAGLASYPGYGCGNSVSVYNMDSINYGTSMYSLANAPYANTNTWAFFTGVLTEIMGLFPSQYIHCGGDEVYATGDTQWTTYAPDVNQMTALGINPNGGSNSIVTYQHWFSTNLANFLHSNGRTMIGWTEIETCGTVTNAALMEWQTGASSFAVQVATNGQPVIMSPNANCYINYCETHGPIPSGGTHSVPATEPYFIVGGVPSYQTVTNVYNFEPIPSALPAQYNTNILGAQCNLWTEYVPSPENVEFKLFPRLCAIAEVTWTPKASKNFGNFWNRMLFHEQRLAAAGINYNHEIGVAGSGITQIGTWGPTVSTTAFTTNYDITPYVSKNGEIDVNFYYTSGSDGLNIYSVALLENGTQIDQQTYTAFSGLAEYLATATMYMPYFIVHLPWFHPGSTYTIQASIAGSGGTSSSGTVYLMNWN